jgi:hypothetical protein
MSERECSNEGGYHKLVLNLDHEAFHRFKRAIDHYRGSNGDTSSAVQAILDRAKGWEQTKRVIASFPGAEVKE